MKILRAADYKRMKWKNGRGETVEIAVFPPHASVDNFIWRVSMASVVENGPFSKFDGIDRTLSVLSGEGIELHIEGRRPVVLKDDSEPFSFAADAPTTANLLNDAITDLNVMTRRGVIGHRVSRMSFEGETILKSRLGYTIAIALSPLTLCQGSYQLGALDGVMLEPGEAAIRLKAEKGGAFFAIEFSEVKPLG